jgi:DegV family protein with EDD domain
MTESRVRVVVDSVADVPQAVRAQYGMAQIPVYVNYDGQSYADDGVELDRAAFYDALPGMSTFPTTSAPPPAIAEEILTSALQSAEHLVVVTVSSRLSATHNVVRLAADTVAPERITVVDSGMLSYGIGMQAVAGAQAAAEQGTVEAVLAAIDSIKARQEEYAAIATLDNLRRSGRLSGLAASLGSILQIKPIVQLAGGEVVAAGRARTFSRAIARLQELVEENMPLEQLVILHIRNETGALALAEQYQAAVSEPIQIIEAAPAMGTHLGTGALGVVLLRQAAQDS